MNRQRKITRLISLASRQQMTVFNRYLADCGIGGGSYVFLVQIVENPGITQTGLSRLISLDKATAGKALRQLEKAGLITRRPDTKDRRQALLEVTEAGHDGYRKILAFSEIYRQALFQGIAPEQQQQLEDILRRITANQKEFLGR